MSSDSACHRESKLISYKSKSEESARSKRRNKSERRRRERSRPKQRTSPKEKLRRSSSVDSGAGGEDEGSASDEDVNHNNKFDGRRGRYIESPDERKRQARSGHQSSRHTHSAGNRTTHTHNTAESAHSSRTTTNNNKNVDEHTPQKQTSNVTSDSAISTSTVSASTLPTSAAESQFLSSPYLSDHSKTSSSSPARARTPELSRALRRKQERLKRQLDLKETRARLERLKFTEKAYQSSKMMVLTSTLSRRRQSSRLSRSSSASSAQRTRSPNSQSFPMGKESRRLSSKGELPQTGNKLNVNDNRDSKLGRRQPEMNRTAHSPSPRRPSPASSSERHPASQVPKVSTRSSPFPNSSASSPRLSPRSPPRSTHSPARDELIPPSSISLYTPNFSSKPETKAAETIHRESSPTSAVEENSRQRSSSRRDASSIRRHRDKNRSSQKTRNQEEEVVEDTVYGAARRDKMQRKNLPEAEAQVKAEAVAEAEEPATVTPVMSSRSEDDFEKLVKRFDESPRLPSSAEQVETRMNHAMDAIFRDGMPDMPSLDEITEKGLMDWRAVFRVEMMRLRKEVNEFRIFCHQQIELHALAVENSWSSPKSSDDGKESTRSKEASARRQEAPKVTEQLKDLESNMKLFQRKQKLLDQETQLLEKEEQLADKVKHLEEYEKEILDVESMLNQRQAICDRRQKALVNLDEELQALRHELEETKDHIHSDGSIPESNSERARKNWDMVRRNLMDKQQLLETTVQKYRSELAAATSTIAGKDILISRLQSAAMHHEDEVASRDKRIQQLESKLTIAISETRNLTDQLSNSSQRDALSIYGRADGGDFMPPSGLRRPSQDTVHDTNRVSFRSSTAYYRRPSSNAGSEQGDEYGSKAPNGTVGGDGTGGFGESSRMNGSRMSRKRNSVSDNAISRLTLSTPRSDDKFGRGSSACTVQ